MTPDKYGRLLIGIGEAVRHLNAGDVVAYPTEAVYGLGCDPLNPEAVQKVLDLKGRDAAKGMILIGGSIDHVEPYLSESAILEELPRARPTWPGPVTWVFSARKGLEIPGVIRDGTIAVRISDHPIVHQLCDAFGTLIVSTSANPAGAPPARKPDDIESSWADATPPVVAGPLGGLERPTQIRDARTNEVLRA